MMDTTIKIVKEKARNNTTVFADYFLNMPVPLHIQEWYSKLDNPEYDRFLIRAPRGHAKSTAITQNWVMHEALYNPDMRILLLAHSDHLAMKFMRYIRNKISSNRLIVEAFRECYPLEKMTEHDLILNRDTEMEGKDPTLACSGRLSHITGRRVDLLVIDDLIDRRDAFSPTIMDKLWEWLSSEAFNILEPNARIVVVGTTKSSNDIYVRLEEKWKT